MKFPSFHILENSSNLVEVPRELIDKDKSVLIAVIVAFAGILAFIASVGLSIASSNDTFSQLTQPNLFDKTKKTVPSQPESLARFLDLRFGLLGLLVAFIAIHYIVAKVKAFEKEKTAKLSMSTAREKLEK